MHGQVAIVTGAGSGIGRAIAIGYAGEGAAVVVNDRASEAAHETVNHIVRAGGKAVAFCGDVAKLEVHQDLISVAVTEFGLLSVLVNNAGIEIHESVLRASPETWEATIGVNLKGAYFLSCKAAPVMIRGGGGKIIHISSVHDFEPLRDSAIYSISKGGVAMLVKSLALELAEFKVNVNAISPGAILTNMNRVSLSDSTVRSKLIEQIPVRRIGEPQDIVGPAIFLACSESDYVTGATIYVDGGLLLS